MWRSQTPPNSSGNVQKHGHLLRFQVNGRQGKISGVHVIQFRWLNSLWDSPGHTSLNFCCFPASWLVKQLLRIIINSNEYFSCDVFFSGMKSSTTWLGNVIAQSPRNMSLSSELFQQFIMVYRTIIGENFHLFIICYDWWCHFPFLQKLSVIAKRFFWWDVP